jgi:hypothetical protein
MLLKYFCFKIVYLLFSCFFQMQVNLKVKTDSHLEKCFRTVLMSAFALTFITSRVLGLCQMRRYNYCCSNAPVIHMSRHQFFKCLSPGSEGCLCALDFFLLCGIVITRLYWVIDFRIVLNSYRFQSLQNLYIGVHAQAHQPSGKWLVQLHRRKPKRPRNEQWIHHGIDQS